MNDITRKITALALCLVLCTGAVGISQAHTQASDAAAPQEETSCVTAAAAAKTAAGKAAFKDETVYVLAGADGSVQKVIVSDWIKNPDNAASIADSSELTDIKVLKGDATYTVDSENMKIWDPQNDDIYYQGTSDKELPVALSVDYQLDGKPISAEALAGKSGKVTIRFSYENHQYETVTLDGRQEKIYVPFAMLTGMLLDSSSFRNIEVTNGKLINDGDHTAVIGFAFPGLQEDLGLNAEQLAIPDCVEITADVKDFSFGSTVTVATNALFAQLDPDTLDRADELTDAFGQLTDAMSQLLDGSCALYDGIGTLLEKSDDLVDGINRLAAGAQQLTDGAAALDGGTIQLQAGIAALSGGLNQLVSKNDELNGGAAQVFNTLLATATAQITDAGLSVTALTIGNYAEVLNGLISSLDETAVYNQTLANVTAAVEENRPLITQQVTAAVREQVQAKVTAAVLAEVTPQVTAAVQKEVTAQVLSAFGMTEDSYDAALAAGMIDEQTQATIEGALATQLASEATQELIAANIADTMASANVVEKIKAETEAQMQTQAMQDTIAENIELQVQKAISEAMASDAVQSVLTAASEGAKSVISLKSALDSYHAFYLGLVTYTGGVADAAGGAAELQSGAAELKNGTSELKGGAATLYAGILQLKSKLPTLVDGVSQLKDGSMQLSDGLKEFNEKGIQKLADFIHDHFDGVLARLKATLTVSKAYYNYSGISDEMNGQVKFIYRTEEINN